MFTYGEWFYAYGEVRLRRPDVCVGAGVLDRPKPISYINQVIIPFFIPFDK